MTPTAALSARRVVVLSGGSPHAHDFEAIGAALVDLVTRAGHHPTLLTDPDDLPAVLTPDPGGTVEGPSDAGVTVPVGSGDPSPDAPAVDALIVHGLWWRMEGPTYDRWRAGHGYHTPVATRRALSRFVAAGGGLLALHTTPICFDDWAEWGDIVGGSWHWGVSSHPPLGPVRPRVAGARHPVTAGFPTTFELTDEVYGDLDLRPGIVPLVTARRHPDDTDQPLVWVHRFGSGPVVFDGLGHDPASLTDPVHAMLLERALGWILEEAGRA